jgi:hypothetical protein
VSELNNERKRGHRFQPGTSTEGSRDQIRQAITDGKLTPRQVLETLRDSKLTPLERNFKRLSVNKALKVVTGCESRRAEADQELTREEGRPRLKDFATGAAAVRVGCAMCSGACAGKLRQP